MLFANKINELNLHIEANSATIAELEARIEALREENNRIASHLQALGSAEAACESAIAQLHTAVAMVNTVDPSMVQTLKDAALAVFNQDVALLAPEPAQEPDEDAQEDPSIEVEVISITTYADMRVAELRTACKKLGIDHRGNKADLINRLEAVKGGSEPAESYPMAA